MNHLLVGVAVGSVVSLAVGVLIVLDKWEDWRP